MSAIRHNDGLVTPFGRVVLVASLGGKKALSTVLAGLPADFSVPIVVAQHRRSVVNSGDVLAHILARQTLLPVRVAEAGVPADKQGVTIVPADTTATIDSDGVWSLTEKMSDIGVGDAVLISSATQVPTIAVILTGRLADGANGCRAVKRNGGRVLVQDPLTAEASSMPANAIATGCADFVLPPNRLAVALLALTTAPGGAELLTVPLPPWACLTPRPRAQNGHYQHNKEEGYPL
jgi:two-component system chemotaxis response regulator CheB